MAPSAGWILGLHSEAEDVHRIFLCIEIPFSGTEKKVVI